MVGKDCDLLRLKQIAFEFAERKNHVNHKDLKNYSLSEYNFFHEYSEYYRREFISRI